LQSLQDDPLQELREKGEIADRPVVVQLRYVAVLLLQQRQNDRLLIAKWVAATIQRSIEQPSKEWCQQMAEFLHDPRRNWVQQARFIRRLTDQFYNFVGLNMGPMIDKTLTQCRPSAEIRRWL
jgi:hypothetical protein